MSEERQPLHPGNAGAPDEDLELGEGQEAETEIEDVDDSGVEDGGEDVEHGDDAGEGESGSEDRDARGAQEAQRRRNVGRRSASEEIRELRRRAQAAEEAVAQFTRQQTDAQRQQQQLQQQQAEAAREQEALASMDPARIGQYYADRTRRETAQQVQQIHVDLWNRSDEGDFQRELDSKEPLRKAFERPAIRDRYDELRRMYPGVSRIDLLDKAIGEAARKNMGAARGRQERRAETEAQGRRTAGTGARGNVAAARDRRGAQRDNFEHMRGVQI